MKKTKIICSIGPSSYDPDIMEKMVNVGMNVARINFSHATEEEKQKVISSVHEVRKRTGKHIAVLYDTKGPEFRNGMLENGEINLVEGKKIRIVKDDIIGNEERFSVNHPNAINSLKKGNVLLLENGLMKIEIVSEEDDGVTGIIINGGVLGNKKSLSVPGVHLDIPFIGDQDRQDIIYACEHEGDFLALSFVSCKEDVLEARKILKEHNREDMKIISKIESATGMENLDSIIEVSDGIMVARGDLGVEIPMQELPIAQKTIVQKCREYGKICVVATEMLESMKKSARPTRAEVSDVANAVLDGTDAVMLSGETTMGKFPIETVRYMADICENTEKYYDYEYRFDENYVQNITTAISHNVVESANILDVKAIIATTISGTTARTISNLKPQSIILAACPNESIARSLALNFGVYPTILPIYDTTDEVINNAVKIAKEYLNLKTKDTVIITGGFPRSGEHATNFLKIQEI